MIPKVSDHSPLPFSIVRVKEFLIRLLLQTFILIKVPDFSLKNKFFKMNFWRAVGLRPVLEHRGPRRSEISEVAAAGGRPQVQRR